MVNYPKQKSRRPKYAGPARIPGSSRRTDPAEAKELNLVYVNPSFTGGTSVNLLNSISQGTDIGNRVGRRVCCRSLQLKYSPSLSAASLAAFKVAIVLDRFPNGTVPTAATIYNLSTGLSQGLSQLNTAQNRARFKTLAEFNHPNVEDFGNSGQGGVNKKFIKLGSIITEYNAAGAMNANAIYAVFIQSSLANDSLISFASKLVFTDS
jgi:Satellite tobacco necrosis virus coat protein.